MSASPHPTSTLVWDGYMADPFALHCSDGFYYAYGTGPVATDGRHFPVLRSADLRHWESCGGALEPLTTLPANADYWAPAVQEHDGTFYLYYSAAPAGEFPLHRLRVATSDRPTGPFRDAGYPLLPDDGFTIDAHPFRDSQSGQWYLYFARDFLDGERAGTGLAVAPLSGDLLHLTGPSQPVLRASADWQVYAWDRELYGTRWRAWHTLEGPCVVERGGRYYCFYSGGAWETPGYCVTYVVADAPTGPWREPETDKRDPAPTMLLHTDPARGWIGPGHNSLITGPDGTDYLVFHSWNTARDKRQMHLAPLVWTDRGPRLAPLPGAGDV